MDPESKKLLEDIFKLTEENNDMLHRIRRSQKIASFVRVAYWVLAIGVAIGLFYFLDPYIEKLQNSFENFGIDMEKLKNLPR